VEAVVDGALVLNAATAAAVILGVIIGVRELRHFSKVRSADVIRSIGEKSSDPEWLKAFLAIQRMPYKTYDEIEGKPEEIALFNWLNFMEGLALMVKHEVVSLDVADDFWHGAIRGVWEKAQPIIETYRKKHDHPEMGEWAEYLYLRIYGKSRGLETRLKELENRVYERRIY